MGRLILWNITTVDGFFEGKGPWDLPWHDLVLGEDLENLSMDQLTSAAGLLFGRVTYEGMGAFWSTATGPIAELMNALPKYVVSQTLGEARWRNSQVIRSEVRSTVTGLKESLEKDLYVFGSAILLQSLMEWNLVDEFRIGVAPYLAGSGRPLFSSGLSPQNLELVSVRPIQKGGILSIYRPKR